eukprot:TRINITY_DN14407_c0_g1_i2.p1 TRINITY_DN14407_c0_g1~~TRINITY_DN14407_c0_g1_i2.p1  ORF type:complete len:809 (+),score=191.04 TRINITY_DN14407_c0_g1_i2:83-2509(+)
MARGVSVSPPPLRALPAPAPPGAQGAARRVPAVPAGPAAYPPFGCPPPELPPRTAPAAHQGPGGGRSPYATNAPGPAASAGPMEAWRAAQSQRRQTPPPSSSPCREMHGMCSPPAAVPAPQAPAAGSSPGVAAVPAPAQAADVSALGPPRRLAETPRLAQPPLLPPPPPECGTLALARLHSTPPRRQSTLGGTAPAAEPLLSASAEPRRRQSTQGGAPPPPGTPPLPPHGRRPSAGEQRQPSAAEAPIVPQHAIPAAAPPAAGRRSAPVVAASWEQRVEAALGRLRQQLGLNVPTIGQLDPAGVPVFESGLLGSEVPAEAQPGPAGGEQTAPGSSRPPSPSGSVASRRAPPRSSTAGMGTPPRSPRQSLLRRSPTGQQPAQQPAQPEGGASPRHLRALTAPLTVELPPQQRSDGCTSPSPPPLPSPEASALPPRPSPRRASTSPSPPVSPPPMKAVLDSRPFAEMLRFTTSQSDLLGHNAGGERAASGSERGGDDQSAAGSTPGRDAPRAGTGTPTESFCKSVLCGPGGKPLPAALFVGSPRVRDAKLDRTQCRRLSAPEVLLERRWPEEGFKKGKRSPRGVLKCKEHRLEVTAWCWSDGCHVMLCAQCKTQHGQGHDVMDIPHSTDQRQVVQERLTELGSQGYLANQILRSSESLRNVFQTRGGVGEEGGDAGGGGGEGGEEEGGEEEEEDEESSDAADAGARHLAAERAALVARRQRANQLAGYNEALGTLAREADSCCAEVGNRIDYLRGKFEATQESWAAVPRHVSGVPPEVAPPPQADAALFGPGATAVCDEHRALVGLLGGS